MSCLKLIFTHRFCGVLSKELCKLRPTYDYLGKKNLYTRESLKITSFAESREKFLRSTPNQNEFKSQMHKNLDEESSYLFFSEDLKKMIRIANSEDDLLLLQKILERFNSQRNNVRFNTFQFGPEIMRLYCVLNKPLEALTLMENEKISTMFQPFVCYVLLADLLFKNKYYKEVITLYNMYRKNQEHRFPSPILLTFYFGACYKLNNPKYYKEAIEVWKTSKEENFMCPHRANQFLAMLAIKQNEGFAALEILTTLPHASITVNLKAMAFAKEKQYDDALFLINQFFSNDVPNNYKHNFICTETVEFLEKEFETSNEEVIKKLQKTKEDLITYNFLTQKPLDEFLCEDKEFISRQARNSKTNRQ